MAVATAVQPPTSAPADEKPNDAARGASKIEGNGALDKALDILDAIGEAPDGLSQGALADLLRLPRTTVYRLLASLIGRGLVRRDPLRRVYCLGFRCFEMARQVYAMSDLVSAAAIELRALRDLTGETSYLAALEGSDVVGLERCDGAHSQRSQAVLGQRKPVYCTSQGKAILSAMDASSRDALVRDLTLKALTQYTITDRRRLQAELKITAARGYAIDDEEIVLGVRCVGAPIVDASGQVRGAISVAGPAFRLTAERLELLGPEVAEAARRVGAQLSVNDTMARDTEVAVVEGHWAFNGAYPRWRPLAGQLLWVDTLGPSLHQATSAGDRVWVESEHPIVGMIVRDDTVWTAHRHGLIALDVDDRLVPVVELPNLNVVAACEGEAGEIWMANEAASGQMEIGTLDAGRVFTARWRLPEPVQCLRWHPTEKVLYATAQQSGTLLRMQPGQTTIRRLATVPKGSGRVSGLAFDKSGGIWTALRDGWSVVRFTADGALDRVVGMPVPAPTDVETGGPDGNRLYVTSARHSVALDVLANAPLSGRLFELDLGLLAKRRDD